MPQLTILYWRDIPAQVIAKQGRKNAKIELPQRFHVAIDKAAMKDGAESTDDYLADWRRGEPQPAEGDLDAIVKAEAERIEEAYPNTRLKTLIEQGGKELA